MGFAEVIERINYLKDEIEKLRPISSEVEARIFQKFRLDWNFHSNNLEGNSLTFGETKSFLLHGITADGKPLKDHMDLKGHNEAILLLDDLIKEKRPLTETFIRELHEIILHEPFERPAITPDGKPTVKKIEIGQYKKTANHVKTVTGETFFFATPEETPSMMNDLMDWYANTVKDSSFHPLILASQFHYKFIRIHPFDDGNGRIARILMNLIIMMKGFQPIIIKTGDKVNYFKALQQADGGNEEFFQSYVGEQLIHSQELFLRGAKGEDIEEADDIDKKIMLLKTRLKEEANKIAFHDSTKTDIINDSIVPLLNTIFSKLNQFDDLFFLKELLYLKSISFPKTAAQPLNLYLKFEISAVANLFKSAEIGDSIKFYLKWKEFIKTDNKLFNMSLIFTVKINKFDFEVIYSNNADESVTTKLFYHRKNDEKKTERISNVLANKALSQIEKKLEE